MKALVAGFAVGVGAACAGGGILAVQRGGSGGWLFFLGLWFLLGTAGAFLLRRLAFPRQLRMRWPGFRRLGRFAGMFVVALLLGEAVGYGAYAMLRGEVLETAWTLPADESGGHEPKGFWTTADAFVRVRANGVASYGVRDGRPRWSRKLSVCEASRNTDEGVGLVSFSSGEKGCDRLTALDLSTGRSLWAAKTDVPDREPGWETGSGIAVRPTRAGLRVIDLQTGKPRRAPRPPAGCTFDSRSPVRVGDGRFVAAASCKDGSVRLVAADLQGKTLWAAEQKAGQITVLSAAPLVLQWKASEKRELLVLDPRDGTRTGTVPVPPQENALVLFGAGRIHVADGKSAVRTYALDGELLWSSTFDGPLRSAHLAGSTLFATYGSGFAAPTTLAALDARSGTVNREVTVPYSASGTGSPILHTTSDRVLFVLQDRSEAQAFAF
ncbi:outer membrane protein assembly factor BamB family protein [Actinocorallia populi]|uniref:outer membrane protein assembly factor BamB family protein n=1 Tax=Actinocorallia populi TaxID=2079200 RepID=UPI000D09233D|nr:PQQ-binding-like beta-propeller repeat protein [Actinocorallia populi]